MQVNLIVTNAFRLDDRWYDVYRLYQNETLLGECFTAAKYNFIWYNDSTIFIENRAPWYKNFDIGFFDHDSRLQLGNYHINRSAFTVNGESWEYKTLNGVERKLNKPSTWLTSPPQAWVAGEKTFRFVFGTPPPREKPWGSPYVLRVATIESNGPHWLAMLFSCYVMADKERRSD